MPYWNDDGTEINPNDFPLPTLCMSCKRRHHEFDQILCNLYRIGHDHDTKFDCDRHASITSEN